MALVMMSESIEQVETPDAAELVEKASTGTSSGLTQSDVDQIRDVVESVVGESSQKLEGSLQDEISTLDASIGATVTEAIPVALKSANDEASGTVQTVELSSEQWEELRGYMDMYAESLTLQNALLLFTLVFSCALVGMRFFSEFSRGFRRG